jgi:hypothetical protein
MSKADDILEHYGVKGMRWGIRRRSGGSNSGRSRHPTAEDHARVSDLKSRPVRALSTRELREVNDRLNLQQNFNRLNPSRINRGQSHVRSVLATAGIVTSAVALFNSPTGRALINTGQRVMARGIPPTQAELTQRLRSL